MQMITPIDIHSILGINELVDLLCTSLQKNEIDHVRFLSTTTRFIGAHEKLVKSILARRLVHLFATHNAFSKELDIVAKHNGKHNHFSFRNRLIDWSESSGEEELAGYDYDVAKRAQEEEEEEKKRRTIAVITQKYSSLLEIEKLATVLKELRKIIKTPTNRFSSQINKMALEHAIHKERMKLDLFIDSQCVL